MKIKIKSLLFMIFCLKSPKKYKIDQYVQEVFSGVKETTDEITSKEKLIEFLLQHKQLILSDNKK